MNKRQIVNAKVKNLKGSYDASKKEHYFVYLV